MKTSAVILRLKLIVSKIISNEYTGYVIGLLFGHKIPFYGTIIDTSFRSISNKTNSDLLFRIYESAEVSQVRKYLNGDCDVIELGGSIGVNTVQIAKKLKHGRRLITIEADKSLIQALDKNININDVAHVTTIINSAIDYSDRDYVRFNLGTSSLSGNVSDSYKNISSYEEVKTITLGQILSDQSINEYESVCDIEGMELYIFYCDISCFDKCNKIIVEIDGAEVNGNEISVNDAIEHVVSLGYRVLDRNDNCIVFSK